MTDRERKAPPSPRATRSLAALVALSAWLAWALPFAMMAGRRGSVAAALWSMIRYFSYLVDLAVALAFSRLALGGQVGPAALGGIALNVALMGVVYRALLAGRYAQSGPQRLGDLCLHTVMPALVILFWALCVPRGALRFADLARWAMVPLTYLAYALAMAGVDGFYPYPFLDGPALGWAAVARNAATIAAGYLLVGVLLVGLDRGLGRRAG